MPTWCQVGTQRFQNPACPLRDAPASGSEKKCGHHPSQIPVPELEKRSFLFRHLLISSFNYRALRDLWIPFDSPECSTEWNKIGTNFWYTPTPELPHAAGLCSALITAVGLTSRTRNSARAGPAGLRRCCSQFSTVRALTPSRLANCAPAVSQSAPRSPGHRVLGNGRCAPAWPCRAGSFRLPGHCPSAPETVFHSSWNSFFYTTPFIASSSLLNVLVISQNIAASSTPSATPWERSFSG